MLHVCASLSSSSSSSSSSPFSEEKQALLLSPLRDADGKSNNVNAQPCSISKATAHAAMEFGMETGFTRKMNLMTLKSRQFF